MRWALVVAAAVLLTAGGIWYYLWDGRRQTDSLGAVTLWPGTVEHRVPLNVTRHDLPEEIRPYFEAARQGTVVEVSDRGHAREIIDTLNRVAEKHGQSSYHNPPFSGVIAYEGTIMSVSETHF